MFASKLYKHFKRKRNDGPPPAESSGIDRGAPNEPRAESSWRWRVTLLIALAIPVFLETLDYTVVATAQTNIASAFRRLELQGYIGTAYLLTSTVFLPVFASVADVYGRHSGLQLSFAFFIFGSALSTGAQSMVMMIVGRGVAGVGAAGMLTIVRVILADSSSLDDNTWQVSMLFLLYSIAFSVGPVFGGLLVSVSFRWVFAINLPFCVAASVLCFFLLRNKVKKGDASRRLPSNPDTGLHWTQKLLYIDWIGAIFFISTGILVLLGLSWGSTEQWNLTRVITCLVLGSLLFAVFIGWQYVLERQELSPTPSPSTLLQVNPMVPLVVFRNYDVCALQYTSFISGMVMLVMFYFIAIFMTIVTGYSATRAGVQLIYFAPGMGLGTAISIFLVKRLRQPKYPIVLGGIVICVALGMIAMGIDRRNQVLVNCFLAVAGTGTGLQLGPVSVQARFSMSAERVAVVTALLLFFRSFGGTVGLAQCSTLLSAKVRAGIISLINSGAIPPSELIELGKAFNHGGLDSLQEIEALSPHLRELVRETFRNAVKWCFLSLIPWSVLSFTLTLFLSNIEDADRRVPQSTAAVPEEKPGAQPNPESTGVE